MKKFWLTLFILAASGQLVAQFLPEGLLHWITKPVLMISLAGYYFGSIHKQYVSMAVALAILFSFSGDVFLMLPDARGLFFMVGSVSFLLAHIFYILAYKKHVDLNGEHQNVPLHNIQKVRFSFPFILLGTGLIAILYPGLGELRLPVIIYATVLVSMVLVAMFRYGYTTSRSFWLVFGGAFFFMLSDSLLAINKFYTSLPQSGVWIMATYCVAQLMIITGLIDHHMHHEKISEDA